MLSEVHCLWPIAPQVDTMSITIAELGENYDLLVSQFTSLTKLHLRSGEPALSGWRLPYLRDLSCDLQSLDWVTSVLRACTTLQRLSVELNDAISDEPAFEEEVRAADRRGMELIQLSKGKRNFATLQSSLQWLTLRLVPERPRRFYDA